MDTQDRKLTIFLICLPVAIVAFFAGNYLDPSKSYTPSPALGDASAVTTDQFDTYWKAWHILDEKFVGAASTTAQDKIWGSIQGLASSYGDPYTVFFPP